MTLKLTLNVNKIWATYFFSKIGYMLFANFVYGKMTTLGDTSRYFGGRTAWESDWFYSSTSMMDSFASLSGSLMGPYLGNLPFMTLSFLGVYYPLSKITLSKRQLYFVLIMLSFPSFGVWTSIASKEAVGVFYLGVILAGYIDLYERDPIKNKALFLLAVYLMLVFKAQYSIGVLALFLFTWLGRRFSLNSGLKLFTFVVAVAIGLLALYLARDIIDSLSKMMPAHFRKDAGSTRENAIWVEQYDFFKNAAYGMYIAFVGPTVHEALSKPTHMLAWIESMVILGAFGMLTLKYILTVAIRSKFNVMFICGFSLAAFWILLVHYPFGALNPGSAIRYRESFYAFLVILFFFMYRNAIVPFSTRRYSRSVNDYHDESGYGRPGSVT